MKNKKKEPCRWYSRDTDKNDALCELCGRTYKQHFKTIPSDCRTNGIQ